MEAQASKPMIRGVDVSHYQEALDWAGLLALKFGFCIAKISDGLAGGDSMAEAHIKGAQEVGMVAGGYHFFRFMQDAKGQADHFWALCQKLAHKPQFLCMDIEWDNSASGKARYGDGKEIDPEGAEKCLVFLKRLEEISGMVPVIYTSYYFFTKVNKPERFLKYPVWVPSYRKDAARVLIPKPWKEMTFWQDSDSFSFKKVKAIDTDWFFGTKEQLLALGKKAGVKTADAEIPVASKDSLA